MIDASPKLAVANRLVKAGRRCVIRDSEDKVREEMPEGRRAVIFSSRTKSE